MQARSANSDPPGADAVKQVDQAELEAEMERLEEGVDEPGSGTLGHGIRVGTPAGGVTEAANSGSAHWGKPRDEQ